MDESGLLSLADCAASVSHFVAVWLVQRLATNQDVLAGCVLPAGNKSPLGDIGNDALTTARQALSSLDIQSVWYIVDIEQAIHKGVLLRR